MPTSSENDNDLFDTTDAQAWAERFVLRVTADPSIATDVGTMIAWFAGAMQTGARAAEFERDEARRAAEKLRNRNHLAALRDAGVLVLPEPGSEALIEDRYGPLPWEADSE